MVAGLRYVGSGTYRLATSNAGIARDSFIRPAITPTLTEVSVLGVVILYVTYIEGERGSATRKSFRVLRGGALFGCLVSSCADSWVVGLPLFLLTTGSARYSAVRQCQKT